MEASTAKRGQLQLSLQAVQDKVHEALPQRREQEAELVDLRSQVAADLPLAVGTPVLSMENLQNDHGCHLIKQPSATSGVHARCAAVLRQWVATATPSAPAPASAMDTAFNEDDVHRMRKDTLDG